MDPRGQPRRYRAVIFDFGGVVMDMGYAEMARLELEYGLPEGAMRHSLYRIPEWAEIQVGRGSRDAYLAGVERSLETFAGKPVPGCMAEWRALVRPLNDEVVELARALRTRYTVALLSNADDRLEALLQERYRIAGLFDPLIVSAKVGLAKPDPAIYRLAAARSGAPLDACIFIDDLRRNAEAATALGMCGITFTDYGDLAEQLRRCGVTW
jgi:putative hydrolase of the HAD superfamily